MDARTIHSAPMLTLTTREGDLDLLDTIPGVGLPTFIRSKRATGRPKDQEALLELEVLRSDGSPPASL
ncbi:MAG: hypothetical protein ABJE47_11910 [bacterium]